MPGRDFRHLDALGLAERIRNGDLSVEEVLDRTLEIVTATDPEIGAIVLLAEAFARDQVKHLDRSAPFAGVPIFVKDLGAQVAGLPRVAGCRYLRDHGVPAVEDSALVRRYKAAGFVILGKTAVPEFGLSLTTEPAIGPPCRNPWNLRHSAGGSSGGAAAAVAAGMVPLAHATDAGGSIRVPAACCGLVGLKPGRGVMPEGPDFGNHLFGLASEHVVTRSVRDSAAVFALTRAQDEGGVEDCLETLERPPSDLRISVLCDSDGGEIAPVCAQAVRRTADLLASLGHRVEQADGADWADDIDAAGEVFPAVISANLAYEIDRLDPAPKHAELEPATWAAVQQGRRLDAKAMVAAQRKLVAVGHRLAARFERIDVLLTPTLAAPPPLLQTPATDRADSAGHPVSLGQLAPFAAVFNVGGQPALSLPAGLNDEGLPLGVQLAGPCGSEMRLLRLARQIEQAAPWPRLAPFAGTQAVP